MLRYPSGFHFLRFWCVLLSWLALGCASVLRGQTAESSVGLDSGDGDAKLFFALGMIESGNDDRGIGRAGEVSRYQILPNVWKSYSESREYQNSDVSLLVARRHWSYLTNYFRDNARREPTPFDMYVMWNTRFGYYARNGFDPDRVSPAVRERAQRFVNLVNR